MSELELRHLKAREIKLLQERTELRSEEDRLMRSPAWPRERVAEILERAERLESELQGIREQIGRVERGEE